MIKLGDFARLQGVTDRQVQRLVKKYAADLEGLYERKGPNGTWLSEEACEILRGKMKSQPVELYDDKKDKLIKKLEKDNEELKSENERLRKERNVAEDDLFNAKQIIIGLQEKEILYLEAKKEADDLHFKNQALQKELEEERNKKWYQKLFGR